MFRILMLLHKLATQLLKTKRRAAPLIIQKAQLRRHLSNSNHRIMLQLPQTLITCNKLKISLLRSQSRWTCRSHRTWPTWMHQSDQCRIWIRRVRCSTSSHQWWIRCTHNSHTTSWVNNSSHTCSIHRACSKCHMVACNHHIWECSHQCLLAFRLLQWCQICNTKVWTCNNLEATTRCHRWCIHRCNKLNTWLRWIRCSTCNSHSRTCKLRLIQVYQLIPNRPILRSKEMMTKVRMLLKLIQRMVFQMIKSLCNINLM